MNHNTPGQLHHNVYVRPSGPTPLRYVDGRWTGHVVTPDQLVFDGTKKGERKYDGCLRLDLHEVISGVLIRGTSSIIGRTALLLGGRGYEGDVKYGHVWLNNLAEPIGGHIKPSGDGRGAPAPATGALWRTKVTAIPGEMHYKPHAGAMWATYGNAGQKDGSPGPGEPYTYLLWSFLNDSHGEINPGGGHARALLRDGMLVRECDVPRIKGYSYDLSGRHNGYVWGAYVRVRGGNRNLYGWIVLAHELESGQRVFHVT